MYPKIPHNDTMNRIFEEYKEVVTTIAESYNKETDIKIKKDIYRRMCQMAINTAEKMENAIEDAWWDEWKKEFFSGFAEVKNNDFSQVPLEKALRSRFEKKYDWSKYGLR